jgi:hypothetical protein
MTKRARVFEYDPVGWDMFDPKTDLQRGDRVQKTQPYGTPRNGTMGMCFVQDVESGEFKGLVMENSLKATNQTAVKRDLAAEARERRSHELRYT